MKEKLLLKNLIIEHSEPSTQPLIDKQHGYETLPLDEPAPSLPSKQIATTEIVSTKTVYVNAAIFGTSMISKMLIDSGANCLVINQRFVSTNNLPTFSFQDNFSVTLADGSITNEPITKACALTFSINKHEDIAHEFLITDIGHTDIILGIDWLHLHNPSINWEKGIVTFNSPYCKLHCHETHLNGYDTTSDDEQTDLYETSDDEEEQH